MRGGNNSGKVLSVLFLAVILVVMVILIVNRETSYVNVQAQISDERLNLEQDIKRLSQLEEISSQEKSMAGTVEAVKMLIPEEPKEDQLIKNIQNISSEVGADFVKISFDPRVQEKEYTEMPVKISYEGNYTSLTEFLVKLRENQRAVRVDNITVKSINSGNAEINAEISAVAFYRVSSESNN